MNRLDLDIIAEQADFRQVCVVEGFRLRRTWMSKVRSFEEYRELSGERSDSFCYDIDHVQDM